MALNPVPTELTTAATDAILALLALYCIRWLGARRSADPAKVREAVDAFPLPPGERVHLGDVVVEGECDPALGWVMDYADITRLFKPLWEQLDKDLVDIGFKDREGQAYEDIVRDALQIKRVSYPNDIIGTASFLASDDSDYMTGQMISIDGGWVTK